MPHVMLILESDQLFSLKSNVTIQAGHQEKQTTNKPEYNTKDRTRYCSALGLFPEADLVERQRDATKAQSRLYWLIWILNYSARTAILDHAFHISNSGPGKVSTPAISAGQLLKQLLPLMFSQQSQNNLSLFKLKILKGLDALVVTG